MNFKDAFESTFTALEFMRPYWLLGIVVVLAFSLWQFKRNKSKKTNIIASHLSEHLVTLPETTKSNRWVLNSLLVIACIALSGPSIRSIKLPVYEIQKAQVIAFDLSFSMYATDIKPNRLSQAKYKAIDLLKQWTEGDKALIAYAGDAFAITPLTRDSNSIINHVPNLSPLLMPARGSRPDLALQKSIELLKNAGYQQGHIVFITDGFDSDSLDKMKDMIEGTDWMVSVLAVATPNGAPIKLPDDSLLKDASDNIIIPKLETNMLYPITSINNGLYLNIDAQGKDVQLLTQHYDNKTQSKETQQAQQKTDNKQLIDDGYWLSFLLLPLFLLFFRKGVFYALVLAVTLPLTTSKVEASIWKNDQQNAYQAFQQGQYQEAIEHFETPEWKGAALFKDKQYKQAEAVYTDQYNADPNNKQALYNLGNSQAMQQNYQQALDSFNKALAIDPDFKEAQANKKAVEDLLKQQEQQQQQQNNKDQQSSDQQQNDDQQSSEKEQNDQQSNEQQASEQQQSDQQQNQQQSSDQDEGDHQQDEQQSQQQNQPSNAKQQKQQDAEQQKQQAAAEENNQQNEQEQQAASQAINTEEQANQEYEDLPTWLKNMPDDPSLLLRNKMRLEYQKRSADQPVIRKENGEIW
ncbi:vWA domain-containing protein [Psychromonas algicola]|uniref:vWA domain-containing protein n=1 Tax=Psychromonas algicola TaxID=2555642 RepID=UPI0010688A34|nr:tetratricopeptide repeat protein [Psychromonas sp. RZ5]TEW52575.1 VWA domain-containing protein [Psychromonas sp. RZ5]